MMFLLDVNALLAMRYTDHVHYTRVHTWASQLASERGHDDVVFATCPITELGFVRVGSGKAGYARNVDAARDDLQDLKSINNMLFIPDDVQTRHLPAWVRKSPQTIDGYLLALAKAHGGHLATLDRFIPGAMFVPEAAVAPLTVREESLSSDWAYLRHGTADQAGSRGYSLR